jgi:hypothetical protein
LRDTFATWTTRAQFIFSSTLQSLVAATWSDAFGDIGSYTEYDNTDRLDDLSGHDGKKLKYAASPLFTEAASGVPQRVFCDACDTTLYCGVELESPSEIIVRYNGTCPKCEKKLSFDPDRVRLLPYDEYLNGPRTQLRI